MACNIPYDLGIDSCQSLKEEHVTCFRRKKAHRAGGFFLTQFAGDCNLSRNTWASIYV